MHTPHDGGEPPDIEHALEHLKEAEHDLALAQEAEHRAEGGANCDGAGQRVDRDIPLVSLESGERA